jgi:hypothetical protein
VGKNGEVGNDEKLANSIEAIRRYEVVGVYESYPQFIQSTARLIGLEPPTQITKVNVTTKRPQVGQISSGLRARLLSLNELDLCFYSEVVNNVANELIHTAKWSKYERPSVIVNSVDGSLSIVNPIEYLSPGREKEFVVSINNTSSEKWVGDTYNPINASYHWLSLAGEAHVFDGYRTRLPESGIMPGNSISLNVRVLAPEERGCYTLVLTLVQEGVCWFERRGFKPALLEVEVR